MKKTIIFLLALMSSLVPLSSPAQNVTTVANGTENNTNIPIYGLFADMFIRQQIIYPAEMMSGMVGSSISAISFYLYEIPNDDWSCAFQFQLGNTQQNSFSPNPNQFITTTFTTVFSNTLVIDASTSTMTIQFSTPYTYTGGNLLLDIQNTESGNFAEASFYGVSTNNYASAYGYNDYGTWLITGETFIPKTTFIHSGEASCLAPDNLQASNIGLHEATLSWTPLSGQHSWRILCDTSIVNLEQASWITVNTDTLYNFTGLQGNTQYTAYIQTNCGTELSGIQTLTFHTLNASTDFPFICDFENETLNNFWAVRNGNQTNQWHIGNAVNNTSGGSKALYISNDNGFSNEYSTNATSDVWAYADINFPDTIGFLLSFDWKASGENCCDYLKVFIGTPVDVEAGNNATPAGATQIGQSYNNHNSWQSVNIPLSESYANSTMRLYLLWHNDNSGGVNPPAAIDNISLTAVTCYQPDNITIHNITTNSVTVDIIPANDNDSEWEIRCTDANNHSQILTTNSTNGNLIENLIPATSYSIFARTVCGEGNNSTWTSSIQFFTDCADSLTLPQTWDFEEDWVTSTAFGQNNNAPLCWSVYNGGTSSSSYPWKWEHSTTTAAAHSGSGAASCYTDHASAAHNDWLITPAIALTGTQQVSFYARRAYSTSTDPEEISVWISEANINLTAPDNNSDTLPGFTMLFQTEIPYGDYQQYRVSLNGYSGKRHIAFVRRHAPYDGYYLRLDDVTVEEAPVTPDCEAPSQLNTLTTSAHTATLSWDGGSHTGHFNLYYKTDIEASYTEIEDVNIDDNGTYILTDLNNNSFYHWYVTAVCNDSIIANSDTASFTTQYSDPATVPFQCDFEDAEENGSWKLINGTQDNQWHIDTAANHTTNGHYALYISQNNGLSNSYNPSISSNTWAYRDIQFNEAAEFQLSFDWRGNGESCCDYLKVFIGPAAEITAGSAYTPQNAVVLFYKLNMSSEWTSARVHLGHEYANTVQRLFFLWHNDNYTGNNPAAAVDNIMIDVFACAKPTQLTISDITATAANITITPASEENMEWQLMIDSLMISTTHTVIPLSNLAPAHIYSISARTICGEGDTSLWTPIQTFMTECLPISSIPQTWDFENNNIGGSSSYPLPSCWSRTGSNMYPYVYNSSANAHSGNYLLYSGADPDNYIVTLPEINTNLLNINDLQLSFFAKAYGSSGISFSKIELGLMSDPAQASTFIPLDSIVSVGNSYSDYILSLVHAPAIGTYPALRLSALGDTNSNGSYNYALMYLDDIQLESIPACSKPSLLEVSNINTTTATLSWINGEEENAWDIAYGVSGFNIDTVSFPLTVTTNPYTLTGLNPHTPYDVYIRSQCSEENVSDWITAPVSFTTPACDTSEQCEYMFLCGDGYGDGWNGAYLSIYQNGIKTGTVEAMNHHLTETSTLDTIRISLCDLLSTTLDWTAGNMDAEISLSVIDPNGVTLFERTNMSTLSSSTLLHFTTNCNGIEICPAPTQLSASNVTQNSAMITWTAGSDENYWELQYKLGAVPIWSYVIPITDSAQYLFSDLIADREYHVRVRAICDDVNQSEYNTVSFFTQGDGISNIALANSISLMPNPADNYIDLRINSTINLREAEVYNAFGQLLLTVPLTDNHARINLSGMASGMYFVRVNGENMIATKKFIKR